jgi:hypothetical protein
MSKLLLRSLPLSTTAPADTPPTLVDVEAAYAALAPQLREAADEKLGPSARTLIAIMKEARKPRQ